ncbi:hypothetical protein BOX15_Mlig004386g1 [Macrostomum lignano]|uniref:PDZ domain-containing protein n=2 Tax=Macrostomum lignano TaxID=282301 RepID=A0A1I8G4C1_9PLAT|nr:hypothetical protein BOX15_Mlig004386g1 [Macrostomum lignano]
MSLYPSLEDYKVDSMARAQAQQAHQQQAVTAAASTGQVALYPSLNQYMGLDVSQWAAAHGSLEVRHAGSGHAQIAPVTQQSVGLRRAEIRQGLRPVTLCKGADGKLGVRVKAISQGLFVAMVYRGSPAALAGLRFGDQIVEVNGEAVAGWSADRAAKAFKGCPVNGIQLMVRDRPFERTVTVHKDSVGHVGFVIKDAAITALVADSSAARNGLLTDHHIVEVNGQNVVGMKDDQIAELMKKSERTVTVTVMPTFVYKHIVSCMGKSLVRKWMDHSIVDEDF